MDYNKEKAKGNSFGADVYILLVSIVIVPYIN